MKLMEAIRFGPKYLRVVVLLTITTLSLLWIRNAIVGDNIFNFLKSNLFSGFVPLLIAFLISKFYAKVNSFLFWIATLLWVLFYPNSPYMISDLIHDSSDTKDLPDLIVFDTLIIFSIAMLSVFYGFLSLKIMFQVFVRKYNSRFAHWAIIATLLLSCLGFYMGREISASFHAGNLYSSDFLTHPMKVLRLAWSSLFPISANIPGYLMMALFGIVQYMLLIIMKDVEDLEKSELITKDS